ncbi:uncharacterized protein LOC101845622 [Aplysia californica]|uniref:Uncharacterized protein LOC101845622 n=1 Tax=Aplysia californica TaxID=6500 RepID=A0ABM0JQB4_APLCA|nr:uncharacterized protein LOC101845622 [Aplysia californica]
MEGDESYLELSEFVNIEYSVGLIKAQALVRGWLVRKHLLEIQQLYEAIVNDIDGDSAMVSWSSGQLGYPVIRKCKANVQKPNTASERMVQNQRLQREKRWPHSSKKSLEDHRFIPTKETSETPGAATIQTRQTDSNNEILSTSEFSPCLETQFGTASTQTNERETTAEFALSPESRIVSDRIVMPSRLSCVKSDSHMVGTSSRMTSIAIQTDDVSFPGRHNSDIVSSKCQNPTHHYAQSEDAVKLADDDSIFTHQQNRSPSLITNTHDAVEISIGTGHTEEPQRVTPEVSEQREDENKDEYDLNKVVSQTEYSSPKEDKTVPGSPVSAGETSHNLPEDTAELEQLQKTTAMELLWVQQAIISRKHYLKLRQQIQ